MSSNEKNTSTGEWKGVITVKNLAGQTFDIETTSSTTVEEFMEKSAIAQGIENDHLIRIVYKGKNLPRSHTLGECNVSPGDTTQMLFAVQAERIGDFGLGNLPGADILESLENPEFVPSEEAIDKLCSEVRVLHGMSPDSSFSSDSNIYRLIPEALDEAGQKSLISHMESQFKGEMDLKYKLKTEELLSLIGESAFDKLTDIYGHAPNEIWLRRVQSNGPHQGINWHVDQAYFTMQVALNGDSEFQGGKLVFAANRKILIPKREAGTATVHGCKVVHAVTPLKNGPRYSLFFLHVPKYQLKVDS